MTPEQVEHFKHKLEEELRTVDEQLRDVSVENEETGEWEAIGGDVDETATEEDEVADRLEQYEENKAESIVLQARLREIEDALGKIDGGTYGVCEKSGDMIEEDRLEANPAARTCKAHM